METVGTACATNVKTKIERTVSMGKLKQQATRGREGKGRDKKRGGGVPMGKHDQKEKNL